MAMRYRTSNGSIFFGNTAVAKVFNSASCSDNHLMYLICLLVFLASYHNFWFTPATLRANRTHKQMHCTEITFFLLSGPTGFTGTTPNSQRAGQLGGTESVLDIHSLDSVGQHYYSAVLAASTIKTYKVAEHRYLDFSSKFAIIPLPVSEATLCYFTACWGNRASHTAQLELIYQEFNRFRLPMDSRTHTWSTCHNFDRY